MRVRICARALCVRVCVCACVRVCVCACVRVCTRTPDSPNDVTLVIRLIHEFSIIGTTTRQPLLMADLECDSCFFFINIKFNGFIFYMEYAIYLNIRIIVVC